LRKGQGGACSQDKNDIKLIWDRWIDWEGHTIPHKKGDRGYNHPIMTSLFAPAELGALDESLWLGLHTGMALIPTINGEPRRITGRDYRRFMYKGKYDPNNTTSGLFKSEILVKAFVAIFFSIDAATLPYPDMLQRIHGCICVGHAYKYRMTFVTPGSIAYTVLQVYFVLSSHNELSDTRHRDLAEVYSSVHGLFRSKVPHLRQYASDLLQWWNVEIFPGDSMGDRAEASGGTLECLELQLAEYSHSNGSDLVSEDEQSPQHIRCII
ncbi:hypothetical protein M0805_003503, partial [Coniferiporia weirii]